MVLPGRRPNDRQTLRQEVTATRHWPIVVQYSRLESRFDIPLQDQPPRMVDIYTSCIVSERCC